MLLMVGSSASTAQTSSEQKVSAMPSPRRRGVFLPFPPRKTAISSEIFCTFAELGENTPFPHTTITPKNSFGHADPCEGSSPLCVQERMLKTKA